MRRKCPLASRFEGGSLRALKALSFFNLKPYLFLGNRRMSHKYAIIGLKKKNMKYISVNSWLKISNGGSTGRPPIQVRRKHVAHIDQNKSWLSG